MWLVKREAGVDGEVKVTEQKVRTKHSKKTESTNQPVGRVNISVSKSLSVHWVLQSCHSPHYSVLQWSSHPAKAGILAADQWAASVCLLAIQPLWQQPCRVSFALCLLSLSILNSWWLSMGLISDSWFKSLKILLLYSYHSAGLWGTGAIQSGNILIHLP